MQELKNMNMPSEKIVDGVETAQEQSFAVRFIDPAVIIEELGFQIDDVVADFGCSSGYFSLPIAKRIGEQGVVYALDILPQSLETVMSKAKSAGLNNIVTKRVNLENEGGSRLPDDSCDWVIMKTVLFQNKNKLAVLAEGKRVLKNGGKILLIEWDVTDVSIGPAINLRISKEALIEIIQQTGLSVLDDVDVSDFHYGLILAK